MRFFVDGKQNGGCDTMRQEVATPFNAPPLISHLLHYDSLFIYSKKKQNKKTNISYKYQVNKQRARVHSGK